MTSKIEMGRYDRQNRTYGEDATIKLANSKVVIIGLSGGLATETCKNLILSGISSIVLIDDGVVHQSDLSSGFYYQESDIGRKRNEVLEYRLKQLNPMANITCMNLNDINFAFFNCLVILHGSSFENAINLNSHFRSNGIKFIWVKTIGVSGVVFVDVLDNHKISDDNGEIIDPVQLASISSDGTVTCAQNNLHDFQDGDFIKFTNLVGEGLEFLSEKNWKINTVNKSKFKIEEFPENSFSFTNGTAVIQKQIKTISHKPLEDQIKDLTIEGFNQDYDSEIIKFYHNEILINTEDCWSEPMENFLNNYESEDIKKIIRSSLLEFMPVVSIIGSFAAMEAIKLLTGKFLPITQWLVYSDVSLIPDSKPEDSKLFGFGNLFGSDFKSKIEKSNFFMVGCGAIGCELLKNLAKLNFCSDGGLLNITDPDHIEQSNLSRQFLFRNEHVKNSKSKVASKMINQMNPNIKINPMEEKMCPENQQLLDEIVPNLFCVINALDNIAARRYMDEQCFRYSLPLFESGTQGMKGNTQPVIPFVTETYSNSSDPPQEKSFPVCTIKNFPNQPEHTIHWAMDYFEFFKRGPENVLNYQNQGTSYFDLLSDYDKNLAKEDIFKYRVKYNPESWKGCLLWATDLFLELYRDQIEQLLYSFPKDSLNSDGESFWSKGKRCPEPINFNLENDLVVDFIESCTHLLAKTRAIDAIFSREELKAELADYEPYQFVVDEDKKAAKDDSELKNEAKQQKEIELPDDCTSMYYVHPEIFEKDDDTNWHIEFIKSASNLRCANYGIPTSTFDEAKGIAGKIVPAVATTTSIVAGLITMEVLKYCRFYDLKKVDNKIIEKYKSWFVSLANNLLIPSEPIPAPMLEFGDVKINSWTKFELKEDMTLGKFILIYGAKFNTELSMVLYGSSIIYASFMASSDSGKLLSEIFKEKYDYDLFSKNAEVVIASEEENLELPTIELKLKLSEKLNI